MVLKMIAMQPLMLRYKIKVVFIEEVICIAIIQYTVTGRGYTFTRHNNKFTMNINTDVFFDDKPVPMCQVALSARVRDEEVRLSANKTNMFEFNIT